MSTDLPGTFIDLVRQVSGEWTNWDSIPVHLGDFGTLNQTGQFIVEDNIYSDKFRKYLEASFDLNAHPAQFTEFDQNRIIFSSGVKWKQLDVDKFVNSPGISSPSFKGTWKFEDGKRGALLILISSYTISIPKVVLAEVLKVKRLEGKPLVTTVRVCPAYLKLLSNTSGETVSVAFSPTVSGVDVANTKVAARWWTDAQSVLLRRDTHPYGKPIFTPLFLLKQSKRSRGEGESESAEEYGWQDVYPTRKALDKGTVLPQAVPTTFGMSLNPSVRPLGSGPSTSSSNGYIKKFIDLVRKVTGMWMSWDPPIPVDVGAYGTLDKDGEFNVDGNIYSDDFQKYLDDNGFKFVARDFLPKLAEPEQDYIVASAGVTRGAFNVNQQLNAAIASASIKGTWKFREGKRGALIMLLRPRTSFIPNEIFAKILNVELLRGKYLVTSGLRCPAYLMYLSNKSGESFSVAFCARTQGDVVNGKVGGDWWTENEAALLRRGSNPNGEYLFMPLFTLKQSLKRSLFTWRGDEEPAGEEYAWRDVYPDWKPLDEDGEEMDD